MIEQLGLHNSRLGCIKTLHKVLVRFKMFAKFSLRSPIVQRKRVIIHFRLGRTSAPRHSPKAMAPIPAPHLVNGFPLTETGELDFSDLEEKYAVSYEEGFDNFIVVDNCPIVADEVRKQKLVAYLRRIFSTNGSIKEDGVYMPMAQNPETRKVESKGYVFIEYNTPEQAAAAIKTKDGHPLDKSHRLSVNRFTDVEKYSTAPDEYVEPEIEPYVPKVKSLMFGGNLTISGTFTKLVKGSSGPRPIPPL